MLLNSGEVCLSSWTMVDDAKQSLLSAWHSRWGALDQRPWACRFNPRLFCCYVATLGKLFTHVPQFIKQYNMVPTKSGDGLQLADCNGRPLPSLWVTSLAGCLPRRSGPTVLKTMGVHLRANDRMERQSVLIALSASSESSILLLWV